MQAQNDIHRATIIAKLMGLAARIDQLQPATLHETFEEICQK